MNCPAPRPAPPIASPSTAFLARIKAGLAANPGLRVAAGFDNQLFVWLTVDHGLITHWDVSTFGDAETTRRDFEHLVARIPPAAELDLPPAAEILAPSPKFVADLYRGIDRMLPMQAVLGREGQLLLMAVANQGVVTAWRYWHAHDPERELAAVRADAQAAARVADALQRLPQIQ